MHRQIGAILLIAGTCIGSGMIALPMVLAKLALIPSLLLMLGIWWVMYYTSLINVELNLQAGQAMTLGSLGRYFSGKSAGFIGTACLKLLSYALLAVFIYGGSSIIQELLASKLGVDYSIDAIATGCALMAIGLLTLPMRLIDYCNRLLFTGLLAVVAILLIGLIFAVDWSALPLFPEQTISLVEWMAIIPVVFTSFGFQVIFHTLTNYCDKNVKMLKRAFLWGSLLPAVVYILWTGSILSVVHRDAPLFYAKMAEGKVGIGELIQVLSSIAKWASIQLLIWWISLLAIATSILGVGVGLCDALKGMLAQKIPNARRRNLLAAVLTIGPAYGVAIYVPNAFIAVLGFAGMILAVIAVLLPIFLFWQMKGKKLHYLELRRKPLIQFSFAVAVAVIFCELWNMF